MAGMKDPAETRTGGRPGLDDDLLRQVVKHLRERKTPKEVKGLTGVGLTKIYEVRRSLENAAT